MDHLRPDKTLGGRGPNDALDEGRTPLTHTERTLPPRSWQLHEPQDRGSLQAV